MRRVAVRSLRLLASVALVTAIAVASNFLPRHLDRVTVALFLLFAVLSIATEWGMPEAVAAALVSALLLDYLYIPPAGLVLTSLPEAIAVLVFLGVAIQTSRLSTQARRRANEAAARELEIKRLYGFGQAILQSVGGVEATIHRGLQEILEIFGGQGVVFYDRVSDRIFRAGEKSHPVSDEDIRGTVREETPRIDSQSGTAIVPVRLGAARIGTLRLVGVLYREETLTAIGNRLGVAIERARAIERESAAESARQSQELKSTVLDALAHSVKTPLTTIRLAASSLLSRKFERSEYSQELLQVIEDETIHLEQFMNDALQVARIDAGLLNLEISLHDVRGLIDSSIEELGAALQNRMVEVSLAADLPPASFDFRLLKLVLKELLTNALKYSPEASPLVIGARLQSEAVVLSVMDAGIGIEESARPHIFERYYRGRAPGRQSSGSGLGLALAKNLVEAHHGKIWVQSEPGAGSVFYFSVPLLPERVP